jgi:hypothetical protein
VNLTIHLYLVPRLRVVELCLHFSIRLHGLALNEIQEKIFLTQSRVLLEKLMGLHVVENFLNLAVPTDDGQ